MSLRLLAILPHRLQTFEEVASAAAILRKLAPLDRAVAEAYWGRSADSFEFLPEGWSVGPKRRAPEDEWGQAGQLNYRSGADTILKFGRRSLILFTVAKWYFARNRIDLLSASHRFFYAFATELAAPGFLVHHDRGSLVEEHVYSGMTYDEVKAAIIAAGACATPSMEGLLVDEVQLRRARTTPDLFYEEILDP